MTQDNQLGTRPASLKLLAKCLKAVLHEVDNRANEVPRWLVAELVVLRNMLETSAAFEPARTDSVGGEGQAQSQENLEKSVDDRYRQFVQRHPHFHVSKAQRGDFWRQIAIGYARQLQSIHEREMADSRARGKVGAQPETEERAEMIDALQSVVNYFWGTEPPVLKEGDVQSLVESALKRARSVSSPQTTKESN